MRRGTGGSLRGLSLRRVWRQLVPYHLTLDDFCEDFRSCEGWDDYALRDAAEGRGGGAADFGEVVSIGSGHLFDHADFAQAMKLPREPGGG